MIAIKFWTEKGAPVLVDSVEEIPDTKATMKIGPDGNYYIFYLDDEEAENLCSHLETWLDAPALGVEVGE